MIARWATIVSVLLCLCAAIPAHARDMRGKGGIGTLVPTSDVLGTTPVIALRYWRRSLAIEALVGFDIASNSLRHDTTNVIHAGGGTTFLFVDGPHLSAGITLRGWLQYRSREHCSGTDCKPNIEQDLGVLFEALLSAEWFFTDHFSISAGVGPALFLASSFETADDKAGLENLLGTNLARGGALIEVGGRYSGGIGILYYF